MGTLCRYYLTFEAAAVRRFLYIAASVKQQCTHCPLLDMITIVQPIPRVLVLTDLLFSPSGFPLCCL